MAIIGISGKIGSGKDTVGTIIQYLKRSQNCPPCSYIKFMDFYYVNNKGNSYNSNWEIKKFASTLKEMVCLLTGCTMAQLEDQEFKNSLLPKQWNYVHCLGFRACPEIYRNDDAFIADPERFIKRYTYREVLQHVGTDMFRKNFHEDVWVNALLSKYRATHYAGIDPIGDQELTVNEIYPNWIITDPRFHNEANAIKNLGGLMIRIDRPEKHYYSQKDESGEMQHHLFERSFSDHLSETSLDNYKFDEIIYNTGNIDYLIEQVKLILKKRNLL